MHHIATAPGRQGLRKRLSEAVVTLLRDHGSPHPLTNIRLQTCGYLRAIREFADFTNDNKFVHLPGRGWQSLRKSIEIRASEGRYALRGIGLPGADLPVIAALSSLGQRFVTMT